LKNDEKDLSSSAVPSYGADISFPHQHRQVSTNYAWLPHNVDPKHYPTPSKYDNMPIQPLGDRQRFYENFLVSCEKFYHEKKGQGLCASTEENRLYMSLRQPSSMQNYTDLGFKKIRTPERVWKILQEFWENNKSKMFFSYLKMNKNIFIFIIVLTFNDYSISVIYIVNWLICYPLSEFIEIMTLLKI
jgi:hypothetical protein